MANPDPQFPHYDDAYDNGGYDNGYDNGYDGGYDGGYDENQNFFLRPGSSSTSAFGWPEQSFASPIDFVEAPVEASTSYQPTQDLAPLGVPAFTSAPNTQGSHETSDPQGYSPPNTQSSAYPLHNSNPPQASNPPPLPENPPLTFIHHQGAPGPPAEVADQNLNQKVNVYICSYILYTLTLSVRSGRYTKRCKR